MENISINSINSFISYKFFEKNEKLGLHNPFLSAQCQHEVVYCFLSTFLKNNSSFFTAHLDR